MDYSVRNWVEIDYSQSRNLNSTYLKMENVEEIEYKMELIHLLLKGYVPKEKQNTVLDYICSEKEWEDILMMEIFLKQVGESEREWKKDL